MRQSPRRVVLSTDGARRFRRPAAAATVNVTKALRAALVAAVLAAMVGGARTHAAAPPKDTPVLLTFAHSAENRLTSDGQTVSVTGRTADYANGQQNVLSSAESTGNYRFTTQNSTGVPASRRMCLDFGTQLMDQGVGVPFTDGQT